MFSANELEDQASRLKGAGKYPEAIAVRLELEGVLAEAKGETGVREKPGSDLNYELWGETGGRP